MGEGKNSGILSERKLRREDSCGKPSINKEKISNKTKSLERKGEIGEYSVPLH